MNTILELKHVDLVADLNRTMKDHKLKLVYNGEINQMITKSFSAIAEREMEASSAEKFRLYKKLYHVMVESLQNICKHSAEQTNLSDEKEFFGSGLFMVSEKEEEFCITTGNSIKNDELTKITTTIDKLGTMEQDEIKLLYRKTIKEGALSEKGGAGLGLIDIARKTGNKIEYSVDPISDEESYLIMKVKVN